MQFGHFRRFEVQFALFLMLWSMLTGQVCAQTEKPSASNPLIRVLVQEGEVEVMRAGAQSWRNAGKDTEVKPGDRLRIPLRSRALLMGPGQQTTVLSEGAEIQILPRPSAHRPSFIISLVKGILYFLQRERAEDVLFQTQFAGAAIRGTEFALEVTEDQTILTVIDGQVELSNAQGRKTFSSGQQGIARPGQAPEQTAALPLLNDVIQWCFYYPAIINPDELALDANTRAALDQSLAAYRSGDLLGALASYPPDRQPLSAPERVYLAQLVLSVGRVGQAEQLLGGQEFSATALNQAGRLATALRRLIATVKLQPTKLGVPGTATNALSSELMADSYYWQATANLDQASARLEKALRSAQAAVSQAPQFGYAWERLAEMQFSFGRTSEALEALQQSLALAPKNAQALALRGFVLAGQNKFKLALASFEQAIKSDPALGNAWLGRGLSRIHQGQAEAGREDLLVAATVEPQRAVLRSYLGKAYANEGDIPRAGRELGLAKRFDPQDPTAWLYSALLDQQENRINQGIRDLEKSQALNDNRSLYRSRLLLDQDRAVRSANLANIFRDNNMTDVSLREAARAVNADYANYSAHLFLASSYDQLRDPNFVNLRLEPAASGEYLIANLLAPVGGGILNPQISQQEYSRLLQQNRLGVVSDTEYLSRGAWIENGAQYGTFDTTSYSIGAFYRSDPGQRANSDVEQRQLLLQVKQQLTPQDAVYLEASQLEIDAGDLVQYYNNVSPFPNLRTKETQEPILTLGYHREWSPGNHTLLLGSWVNDDYRYSNPRSISLLTATTDGVPQSFNLVPINTQFRNRIEVFSIEPQQIWEQDKNVAILGGRYQAGDFRMQNVQTDPFGPVFFYSNPAASQDLTSHFQRFSLYAYDQYQVRPSLWLTAGLVYEQVTFPRNLFAPPFLDQTTTEDQLSPKAGLIWTAPTDTTVRFGYGRSLTGASLEQSVRIEPTQVAGFNQALRGIMPESVTGSIPGARIQTFDLSIEQKMRSGTYLGLAGEIADSDVKRTVGTFNRVLVFPPPAGFPPPAVPSSLGQQLDYGEKSVRFTADQLVGQLWSLGARYQLTYADLHQSFVSIPTTLYPRQDSQSVFHQVGLVGTFNHPSGVFAQLEADWYSQSNHGSAPGPGDEFWQLDLFAGYRFLHRRAEVSVGVLNLNDADYHLDPLTFYSELPRSRTIVARFRFNF